MAVTIRDLRPLISSGGVPDLGFRQDLGLFSGTVRGISSDAGDSGNVNVQYRDRDSQDQFDFNIGINGQTPVDVPGADIETVLNVTKGFANAGDLIVCNDTPTETGTAQGGAADFLQLRAGASAVDDIFAGCVGRIVSGAGAGQVFAGIRYNGTTKDLELLTDLDTPPDATSVYEIYPAGVFIPRDSAGLWAGIFSPLLSYSSGNPGLEAPGSHYAQLFLYNTHPTDTITSLVLKEVADTDNRFDFALDPAINGSGDPQPADGDFDSSDKAIPGGQLGPGEYIGVWIRLTPGALRGRAVVRMHWEGDDGVGTIGITFPIATAWGGPAALTGDEVSPQRLLVKAAAAMPEDDDALLGGAVDLASSVMFASSPGFYQLVGSDEADLTVSVELTYFDGVRRLQTQARVVQGRLPIAFVQPALRLLKATKNAAAAGDIAIEHQVPTYFDFAVSGDESSAVLQSSAPATSGVLVGQVARVTDGAGEGELAQVIAYDGPSRTCILSRILGAALDSSSKIRIAPGMVFRKEPTGDEDMVVTRVIFAVTPAPEGGGQRKVYTKLFFLNSGTTALDNGVVSLVSGAGWKFGLPAALNDDDDTPNRRTPPVGISFDVTDQSAPASLAPGDALGVWGELTVEADAPTVDLSPIFSLVGDPA